MGAVESLTNIADSILGAPSGLPQLENVSQVSPRVIRVLGQNPGQATLQGTNTYIVGKGRRRALIDTSDGNACWWLVMERALKENDIELEFVILTHRHSDHIGGVTVVCDAFPNASVWKASSSDSRKSVIDPAVETPNPPPPVLDDVSNGVERLRSEVGRRGARFCTRADGAKRCTNDCGCQDGVVSSSWQALEHGQIIELECGSKLRIISTPGHTEDSVSILLMADDGEGAAIFTGDTVLGGRTTRFDDVRQYEASLSGLRREVCNAPRGQAVLFPGHGGVISAGSSLTYLDSLLGAQRKRQQAIITTLRENPGISADDICGSLYDSMAARHMGFKIIEQHLHALEADNRARQHSTFFGTVVWEMID